MVKAASLRNTKVHPLQKFWKELTADRSQPEKRRLTAREVSSLFNMLSTLIDNGMPLQKALLSLANDPSQKKQRKILTLLHNRMVEGSTFHQALARYPQVFSAMLVQQIKLGESSGNLSAALRRIIAQMESWMKLRNSLMQKLSYPALVILAGSGLMAFMLTTVVPQFETIYSESNVQLPWVTSVVTTLSRTIMNNLWLPAVPVLLAIGIWIWARSSAKARRRFDQILTRIPVLGAFIRDIAVLQFVRSAHALSEAGFVPIDAISGACSTVSNNHVRHQLVGMSNVLVHGTKLSVAMDSLDSLIPNAVRQLIMVGEHSGNITKACEGACEFLENRLQRRIGGVMGMIEPLLTVGLATCIGWVVLAMYMPMFKMFDVLDY